MKNTTKVAGATAVAILGVGAGYLTLRPPRDAVMLEVVPQASGLESLSPPRGTVPDPRGNAEAILGRAVALMRSDTTRPEGEALLRTLVHDDIPADVRSQAFRLLAQMEIGHGDDAAAISDLEQVLALINAGDAGFGHSAASEASAMNQLMMLRLRNKDVAGAIEANAAALSLPLATLPQDMRATALYHHAMLTRRSGRLGEALQHIRSAKDFASEHELGDMMVRSQVLEASILSEQKEWGAAVDVLRVLWDRTAEPTYADRAPPIALQLVSALQHAGKAIDAVEMSRQAVERLRGHAAPKDPVENHRVRVSLLSGMVAADLLGRPGDALWALDQLESLVHADQSARETIAVQRQAVYDRLSQPQGP